MLIGFGSFANPAAACACTTGIPLGPNGPVNAIASAPDGSVFIGGDFTHWGYQTGGFASLDSTDASVNDSMPWVDGYVSAIEPDGAGGFFIGGDFDRVGGLERENLAHIDPTGQVTDWQPTMELPDIVDGTIYRKVWVLAFDDVSDTLYVGGQYDSDPHSDDSDRWPMLASVDTGTGLWSTWAPVIDDAGDGYWRNFSSGIYGVEISGRTLYVGGAFSIGTPAIRTGAAAFGLSDLVTDPELLSWAPNPNGPVAALLVKGTSPTRVVLGGYFDEVGNSSRVPRLSVAEVDGVTGVATSFVANAEEGYVDGGSIVSFPGNVYSLALVGGTLLIGGGFDLVDREWRSNLAAVDAAGGVNSWDPDPDSYVESIAVSDGQIYVAGDFGEFEGGASPPIKRTGVAQFNGDLISSVPTSWDAGLDSTGKVVAVVGGRAMVGGFFEVADSTPVDHLAKLDSRGMLTRELGNTEDISGVSALRVVGNYLYAAGKATDPDIDPETVVPTYWLSRIPMSSLGVSEPIATTNQRISTLENNAGALFVGGSFTTVTRDAVITSASYAFALDLDPLVVTPFGGPSFPGEVLDLYVTGDWVYAVGEGPISGSYLGGTPFAMRASLSSRVIDATWNVDFSGGGSPQYGSALSVSEWNGSIVVGGRMLSSMDAGDPGFSLLFVSPINAAIEWRPSLNGRSRVNAMIPDPLGFYIAGSGNLGTDNESHARYGVALLSNPTTINDWEVSLGRVKAIERVPTTDGPLIFAGGSMDVESGAIANSPRRYLGIMMGATANGGGGGGGGGGEAPANNPTQSVGTTPLLPALNTFGPDASLNLRPGEVAMITDGERVPAKRKVGPRNTSIVVTGGGSSLIVPSPLGLGGGGSPQWQPGLSTSLDTTGFGPGSTVQAYLLSAPTLIGSAQVTTTNKGSVAVTVPATLTSGSHTLQVIGKNSAGKSLIIAVGIRVAEKPESLGTQVIFSEGSVQLTKSAKASLRSLVKQLSAQSVLPPSGRSVGVMRMTGKRSTDIRLASLRAETVTKYLKSIGFKGEMNSRTVSALEREFNRQVDVTITWPTPPTSP